MDDDVQALVAEQVTYYRARAPDYDGAYLGKNWDQCIDGLPIAGDVLELACGTVRPTPPSPVMRLPRRARRGPSVAPGASGDDEGAPVMPRRRSDLR